MESGPTSGNLDNFHNPRPRSFKSYARGFFGEKYMGRFRLDERGLPYGAAAIMLTAGLLSYISFLAASTFYLSLASAVLTVAGATAVFKIKDWKATKEYKIFLADNRIEPNGLLVELTNDERNTDIAPYFYKAKRAFYSEWAYLESLLVWPATYIPGSKESNAWYAGFKAGEVEKINSDQKLERLLAAVDRVIRNPAR